MRTIRALVFCLAGVGLALSAHRLAGGLLPGPLVITASAAMLFAAGLAVSRRELVGRHVALLVGVTQAALHAIFAVTPTASSPVGASGSRWANLLFCQHGDHPVSAAKVAAASAHLSGGALSGTEATSPAAGGLAAVLMLAAHVLAAALMAWWLRRGERAAWAVVRRIVTRLTRFLDGPVLGWARSVPGVYDVWTPVRRVRGTGLAGRGPPRLGRSLLLTA